MLGVEPQWVVSCSTPFIGARKQLTLQHGLDEDVPFEMPNTGGVKVTVIEANHCELDVVHLGLSDSSWCRPRLFHLPL
jgi:hypothetical protein